MIHVFSTGNYITVFSQPALVSFARYLFHGPPIVYLLLKEQILFLQVKIVLTALALCGKNGKAQKRNFCRSCANFTVVMHCTAMNGIPMVKSWRYDLYTVQQFYQFDVHGAK